MFKIPFFKTYTSNISRDDGQKLFFFFTKSLVIALRIYTSLLFGSAPKPDLAVGQCRSIASHNRATMATFVLVTPKPAAIAYTWINLYVILFFFFLHFFITYYCYFYYLYLSTRRASFLVDVRVYLSTWEEKRACERRADT